MEKNAIKMKIKKNKKAEENTTFFPTFVVKVIIGVLCLVILVFLFVAIYNMFFRNSALEKARTNLRDLVFQIEGLKDGQEVNYMVLGPNKWYVIFIRPEGYYFSSCQGKDCVCICPNKNVVDCTQNGVCRGLNYTLNLEILDSETDATPSGSEHYRAPTKILQLNILIDGLAELRLSRQGNIMGVNLDNIPKSILDREINYKGKQQKIVDAIKASLEPYFSAKIEEKLGIFTIDTRIAKVNYGTSEELNDLGLSSEDVNAIKDGNLELANAIKAELDKMCNEYYFEIPQGVISHKNPLETNIMRGRMIFVMVPRPPGYSPTLKYEFDYKNKKIELKYMMLKKC
jgi:hypothetical protein